VWVGGVQSDGRARAKPLAEQGQSDGRVRAKRWQSEGRVLAERGQSAGRARVPLSFPILSQQLSRSIQTVKIKN